jgi:hypothetical protein
MTVAERYHFADFTRANYRRLLELAIKTYRPRTYTTFDRDERFLLCRHDVDYSPQSALRLARIEAELGVVSTYFLHLHNTFYNVLEQPVASCVREILGLGHALGLHFDSHFYGIESADRLDHFLRFERRILEEIFGVAVPVFSFHVSTPFTMGCRDWEYGGMIHVHAAYFQDEVGYCSDSNGIWRHRRLEDVLRSATDQRLQLLTHPAWWQDRPMSPRARIWRSVGGRAVAAMEDYDRLLGSMGRENISADPSEFPPIHPPTVST